MLVVISIISIFVGVIGFGFLRGSASSTVGLQSAQSSLASLLTQARSQAALTGRSAAVLVGADPDNTDRFCRYLVPVLRNAAGTDWEPLTDGLYLPQGCYVVRSSLPTGDAIEPSANWSGLNSTALAYSVSTAVNSTNTELWVGTQFTYRGTATNNGQIVIATGRPNTAEATNPVRFMNPDNVRGVTITAYGAITYINEQTGF